MGGNGPKQVKTLNLDVMCKFRFSVSSDSFGFYIVLKYNSGNSVHIGHPKPFDGVNIPIPTRLLSKEQKDDIMYVKESSGSNALVRNFMRGKFGKFISKIKVKYLSWKNSDNDGEKIDDIASMLNSFKNSKEIHYTTLSDMPVSLMAISGNDITHLLLNTSSCDTGNKHSINDTITISTTKSQNDEEAKNKLVKEIKDLAPIEEKSKNGEIG